MLANFKKTKFLLFAIITIVTMVFSGSVIAKACKGMSKSTCSKSTSCTWVNGYKTKTGNKVASYCRNKASKKSTSAKTNKKSPVKKADTKKASTKKAKKKATKTTKKKAKTKKSNTKDKKK